MSRCAWCNLEVAAGSSLCAHHDVPEAGWAASNRIMCDFLHRGLLPPRVDDRDRENDLWGCLAEVA
jgi:hypothetical protein